MAVAVVCIGVYPLGIPLVFFVLLYKDEQKRQQTVHMMHTVHTAVQDPRLPPGWQKVCTPEGHPYYKNSVVGTTWDPVPWLPEGWAQAIDKASGKSWCASIDLIDPVMCSLYATLYLFCVGTGTRLQMKANGRHLKAVSFQKYKNVHIVKVTSL